jgi:cbb3-type cytochrome oxidase cytochrome c subunit
MLVPSSIMPSYKFSASDMQDLVSYLFTLPDKAPGQ